MRKGNVTILACILAIALAAAGAGMGTMAWFSSEAESLGNTFTAGTLKLKLSDPRASIHVPYVFTNMAPGDTVSGTIIAGNRGSLAGDLYGRCSYTETNDPYPESDLGIALLVIDFQVDGVQVPSVIGMTLKDFCVPYPAWDSYGILTASAVRTFYLEIEFDPGAGNEYQGDGVSVDFEFYLNQIGAPAPVA